MEQLYEEIETKRDSKEQMRIQTDLEFRQREIQKLNQKCFNVSYKNKRWESICCQTKDQRI